MGPLLEPFHDPACRRAELQSSGKELLSRAEGELRTRQIKGKYERIATLSSRARTSEVVAKGWKARAKAANQTDQDGAESALRDFLLSANFALKGGSIISALATLRFFEDRSLAMDVSYYSASVRAD